MSGLFALNEFELHVPEQALRQGLQLIEKQEVLVERNAPGMYTSVFTDGTQCSIEIKDEFVRAKRCDCAKAAKGWCEHMAALLLQLEMGNLAMEEKPLKPKKKKDDADTPKEKKSKQPKWSLETELMALLAPLDVHELRNEILEIYKGSAFWRFQLYFAHPGPPSLENNARYQTLIKDIFTERFGRRKLVDGPELTELKRLFYEVKKKAFSITQPAIGTQLLTALLVHTCTNQLFIKSFHYSYEDESKILLEELSALANKPENESVRPQVFAEVLNLYDTLHVDLPNMVEKSMAIFLSNHAIDEPKQTAALDAMRKMSKKSSMAYHKFSIEFRMYKLYHQWMGNDAAAEFRAANPGNIQFLVHDLQMHWNEGEYAAAYTTAMQLLKKNHYAHGVKGIDVYRIAFAAAIKMEAYADAWKVLLMRMNEDHGEVIEYIRQLLPHTNAEDLKNYSTMLNQLFSYDNGRKTNKLCWQIATEDYKAVEKTALDSTHVFVSLWLQRVSFLSYLPTSLAIRVAQKMHHYVSYGQDRYTYPNLYDQLNEFLSFHANAAESPATVASTKPSVDEKVNEVMQRLESMQRRKQDSNQ